MAVHAYTYIEMHAYGWLVRSYANHHGLIGLLSGQAPPDVDSAKGYMLHSVKTANATYGHHGEMAWQQMYII